jgi:hypothetical protein
MAFDRWERRSGLWVRRRDDGDWDYFPTLRAPVAGLRLDAACVARIGQSDLVGKALAFGVGLPILGFSLVILATRLNLGFLADPRSRGLLYLLGLVIVVAASVARPIARQAALKRAAASDTVLSPDELQGIGGWIDPVALDNQAGPRPGISGGARRALTMTVAALAALAVLIFLIGLAFGLETTMLVTGIAATLCMLVAMRLWYLSRESV